MITLKNIAEASLQDIFDQAANHLLTQMKLSRNDITGFASSSCQYRSNTGLKCAVGCFIADDEYSEDMEGESVEMLIDLGFMRSIDHDRLKLLDGLQSMHDGLDPDQWSSALEGMAAEFNLNFTRK